jgi:hypothetical protein
MTIVLVHGVPETSAVWDLLVDELIALGHARDRPIRFGGDIMPIDGIAAGGRDGLRHIVS